MANEAKGAVGGEEKGRAETKPKVAIIKLHFVNAAAAVAISKRESEGGRGDKDRGDREGERERYIKSIQWKYKIAALIDTL